MMLQPCSLLVYDHKVMRSILQVAIIVFLSHIGSFVPADSATVGLTDRYHFLMNRVLCEMGVTLLYADLSFTIIMFSFFFLWGGGGYILEYFVQQEAGL